LGFKTSGQVRKDEKKGEEPPIVGGGAITITKFLQ
jgi:hypothetical protein